MNYDCERPTSRVIRPPGGGSSNIFGDPVQAAPTNNNKATNPNFKSSVFDSDPQTTSPSKTSVSDKRPVSRTYQSTVFQKEGKPAIKPATPTFSSTVFIQPDDSSKALARPDMARKISNVPMFDSSPKRPSSAPSQARKSSIQSNIFASADYPTKASHEPGKKVFRQTAFKKANANLQSSVFSQDNATSMPIPKQKKYMKSTVFAAPPPLSVPAAGNKTFVSNLNGEIAYKIGKKQIPKAKEKHFTDSGCDVLHETATIFTSDTSRSQMSHLCKPPTVKPQPCTISLGQEVEPDANNKCKNTPTYKSVAFDVCKASAPIWASGHRPAYVQGKQRKATARSKSQVFGAPIPNAALWSSDFKPTTLKLRV